MRLHQERSDMHRLSMSHGREAAVGKSLSCQTLRCYPFKLIYMPRFYFLSFNAGHTDSCWSLADPGAHACGAAPGAPASARAGAHGRAAPRFYQLLRGPSRAADRAACRPSDCAASQGRSPVICFCRARQMVELRPAFVSSCADPAGLLSVRPAVCLNSAAALCQVLFHDLCACQLGTD